MAPPDIAGGGHGRIDDVLRDGHYTTDVPRNEQTGAVGREGLANGTSFGSHDSVLRDTCTVVRPVPRSKLGARSSTPTPAPTIPATP